MNNDLPRMLYQANGSEEIHGGRFATRIVETDDELAAALASGWSMTTGEALDAVKPAPKPEPIADTGPTALDDDSEPTRDELEAKATELGIEFSPRIGDVKLGERIAAALAGK